VNAERLVSMLRSRGVHKKLVRLIASWSMQRVAYTCVDGTFSDGLALFNMVFQGTGFGPMPWNVYYADVSDAVLSKGFTETVFADDLHCFRILGGSIGDDFDFQADP